MSGSATREGWWRAAVVTGLLISQVVFLSAQPGPPPPPPPPPPHKPAIAERMGDLSKKLASTKGVNLTAQRALEYSRIYWKTAQTARSSGELFAADRFADAADALLHIAEHQQHLRDGGGAKGPAAAEDVQHHLERVYFRIQQADYFLQQAHDARAASFPQWARDFRMLALRGFDRKDMVAADENAKCAEEVLRALEDLAQAAAPPADRPPPLPPPPPPAPPGARQPR